MKQLSDKDIEEAFDGDFGEVVFDHKPTEEDIFLIKLKLVARKAEQERDKEWIKWFELRQVASEPGVEEVPFFGGKVRLLKCRRFRVEEEEWQEIKQVEE